MILLGLSIIALIGGWLYAVEQVNAVTDRWLDED